MRVLQLILHKGPYQFVIFCRQDGVGQTPHFGKLSVKGAHVFGQVADEDAVRRRFESRIQEGESLLHFLSCQSLFGHVLHDFDDGDQIARAVMDGGGIKGEIAVFAVEMRIPPLRMQTICSLAA